MGVLGRRAHLADATGCLIGCALKHVFVFSGTAQSQAVVDLRGPQVLGEDTFSTTGRESRQILTGRRYGVNLSTTYSITEGTRTH